MRTENVLDALLSGSDHPELTERIIEAHSGPIEIIERSTFFENLVLTVGGWTFKLWIDDKDTPIFVSPPSQRKYTSGLSAFNLPNISSHEFQGHGVPREQELSFWALSLDSWSCGT